MMKNLFKMIPKQIGIEKERLYEELLKAKNFINFLEKENA